MPPPATITIHESVIIPAKPDVVWAKLNDPHFVVLCVPGAHVQSESPEGVITGSLQVKLGPTVVDFSGTATPVYEQDAHHGALTAQAADKSGRSRMQAHLNFVVEPEAGPDGASASKVSFDGTISLAGGLSSFLQTGGVHLTRRMMKDFADQMSARIVHAEAVAAAADDPTGAVVAPPEPVNKPVSGFRVVALTTWDLLRSLFQRKSRT